MSELIDRYFSEDVKLDERGQQHFLSLSSIKKSECYALYRVVKNAKPVKTLEIGFALGASAVGILAGKIESGINEKHIVLDPFQSLSSNNVGLKVLESNGLRQNLTLHESFSEDYLNRMFWEKELFDFIFIDGSHTIGQAVTDAFLADKILSPGGIIGIHDTLLFSTAASIKYLIQQRNYKVVYPGPYSFKNAVRQVKYIRKLGVWYCLNVVPKVYSSLIFLQKGAS